MQSAELALVHNVKSGWKDCGLHHLCPNAKIIHFMHILLKQWQYSYYAAQSKREGVFFLASPIRSYFMYPTCIPMNLATQWETATRKHNTVLSY